LGSGLLRKHVNKKEFKRIIFHHQKQQQPHHGSSCWAVPFIMMKRVCLFLGSPVILYPSVYIDEAGSGKFFSGIIFMFQPFILHVFVTVTYCAVNNLVKLQKKWFAFHIVNFTIE
jgi:hypothetical protein